MGLQNGDIKDDQIHVSSNKSSESASRYGRLGTKAVSGVNIGGWMPNIKEGSYFIVDFLNKVKITGVITQGRDGYNNWMKTFKLRFSVDHGSLHWFQESGKPKVNV